MIDRKPFNKIDCHILLLFNAVAFYHCNFICRSSSSLSKCAMEPLPARSTAPFDPSSAANPDGLTYTMCATDLVVYGGWHADRIWVCNLPSATWSEIVTTGDVPPARLFHSAAFYNGHLLVTGGERLSGEDRALYKLLSYYEMSVSTSEWLAVECYGNIPMHRSYHTSAVVNDELYVLGGRPGDGTLTAAGLAEAKRGGFYDVNVLHIVSRTWRRIEMYDPASPMLWGHSMAKFRDSFLLLFGGFDVSSTDMARSANMPPGSSSVDSAPVASLSNIVHILKLDNMTWMKYTPSSGEAAPVSRAFHVSFSHGAELVTFGGFTIDFAGRAINVNDCWVWSVEYGRWSRIEFCVPTWPSKKLISAMYGDQLLVAPSLNHVFSLDMSRKGVGWLKIACQIEGRPREPERKIDDTVHDQHQKHSSRSHTPAAQYESEVEHLRREVEELRQQLRRKDSHSPPHGALQDPVDHPLPQPPRLQRWLEVAPSTATAPIPTPYDPPSHTHMSWNPEARRLPRPKVHTPPSSLPTAERTSSRPQLVPANERRAAVAQERRSKIQQLQERIRTLEESTQTREKKIALVDEIRKEVRQLESKATETEPTLVPIRQPNKQNFSNHSAAPRELPLLYRPSRDEPVKSTLAVSESRADSPLRDYWSELENALRQEPIVRRTV